MYCETDSYYPPENATWFYEPNESVLVDYDEVVFACVPFPPTTSPSLSPSCTPTKMPTTSIPTKFPRKFLSFSNQIEINYLLLVSPPEIAIFLFVLQLFLIFYNFWCLPY